MHILSLIAVQDIEDGFSTVLALGLVVNI